MRCIDLNHQEYNWKIKGNLLHKNITRETRSSYHLEVRTILQELFPTMHIYEEVPIYPYKNKAPLFLDFYVPIKNLAIEVHGEQHYKYMPFFHVTQIGFILQKRHDKDKAEWCKINGIQLLILSYEDQNEWRKQLGC